MNREKKVVQDIPKKVKSNKSDNVQPEKKLIKVPEEKKKLIKVIEEKKK